MFALVKRNPLFGRGLARGSFDNLFQDLLPVNYRDFMMYPETAFPAIDIVDKENHFLVKAEVPGFKKEELDISIEGDVLTLTGETKNEKEEEKENYYYKESKYGSFQRSVRLSSEINRDGIKASLKDGILHVELPKLEEKKPTKVEIDK